MGTIYTVDQMWSRMGGDANVSDRGRTFGASFREAYQITCTADTTTLEIMNAPGLPLLNSIYPGFPGVYCDRISPNRVSPIYWIVEVSYSGDSGSTPGDDPLSKPPIVDWTDAETEEAIDEDYNGNPITTVNGERIEGVTKKLADQVVTIRRNYASFSPYATSAYRDSVSSDTFMGYPAGTARLIRFSAQQVVDSSIGYWDVTASIQFRIPYNTTAQKAWWARVRHEGYYIKSGSIIRRALDTDLTSTSPGEPMTRPVLLKTDGTIETTVANAVWLEFQLYAELPYASLGLV